MSFKFPYPSSFYGTQIIIPFLNSRISANHDKGDGFQPIVKRLIPLYCSSSVESLLFQVIQPYNKLFYVQTNRHISLPQNNLSISITFNNPIKASFYYQKYPVKIQPRTTQIQPRTTQIQPQHTRISNPKQKKYRLIKCFVILKFKQAFVQSDLI